MCLDNYKSIEIFGNIWNFDVFFFEMTWVNWHKLRAHKLSNVIISFQVQGKCSYLYREEEFMNFEGWKISVYKILTVYCLHVEVRNR